MTEMSKYAPGTFSWVELTTTDQEAAKKFYTDLFNWHVVDIPIDANSVYTMLQVDGKDAAALSGMDPEQKAQGAPPAWLSYVTVENVDNSTAKAKELGGQVMAGPFDVMDVGRMALLQDPTGAMFAIWEPKTHIGAKIVNEPVSLSWNELVTTDAEKAGAFYTQLFGWSAHAQDMGGRIYTTFLNGERPNGGMMQMSEEWGDVPPHWMVYFAVADCDATAEKAKELGGQVSMPPTDIPETGRFSMLVDPQGAAFAVIKLSNPM